MTGIEQSLLVPKDAPFLFPEGIAKFLSHLLQGSSSLQTNLGRSSLPYIFPVQPVPYCLTKCPSPVPSPGEGTHGWWLHP